MGMKQENNQYIQVVPDYNHFLITRLGSILAQVTNTYQYRYNYFLITRLGAGC